MKTYTPAAILFVTGIVLFASSAATLIGAVAEANRYAAHMSEMIFLGSLALIAVSLHLTRSR